MPRWKDLPDDLDPQIKEFTSQIRRLVDRSGLSVAALADRTGYSKTSWERYLGGRLLAPKGAVVALAEVTGTSPVHLTTMWELAERAWSRSEMRHDGTMEAIRISQARAALGEFGAAEATGGPSGRVSGGSSGRSSERPSGRKNGSATVTPGIAGPAGVSPTIPPQPTGADADARDAEGRGDKSAGRRADSWGPAGYQGPPRANARPGSDPGDPRAPRPAEGEPEPGSGGRQRLTMFLAGLVGVLVVIAAVFFFTDRSGGKHQDAAPPPSPTATRHASPPAGGKCAGSACTGKDAEAMGCSGDLVSTAKTATVGTTTLEVRYSKACGTAWGRITGATRGDKVEISAGPVRQTGEITATGDAIAYTPMVAVQNATDAKACATLASGRTGCTK
ncbi:DUF2690 domain-containing protein [Streptomyces sp. NPDC046942]|uniref:DUF2690 domain-containing protein n=1 Tax=Streptomyces sp. NPDC046942 TaxID=3155137 RepID=UPI0033CBEF2D